MTKDKMGLILHIGPYANGHLYCGLY